MTLEHIERYAEGAEERRHRVGRRFPRCCCRSTPATRDKHRPCRRTAPGAPPDCPPGRPACAARCAAPALSDQGKESCFQLCVKLKSARSQTSLRSCASRRTSTLPEDVKCAIRSCRACEDGEIAQGVLDNIIENFEIADSECVPDLPGYRHGLRVPRDRPGRAPLVGGDLTEAVNEGVRRGYDKGYLRKSVVKDPVRRGNTGDNTPAMLYTEIVPGENIKITVGPKGFGSENMSQIRMFKPSAGLQGIKDFILEVVETAGPNPCPADGRRASASAARSTRRRCSAKKALMRPLDSENPDPVLQRTLEKEMPREGQPARHRPAGLRRQDDGNRPQTSRRCRRTSPACRAPSTSTAT